MLSMVPQVAPEQPEPETFQVTAVFDALLTTAVNFCCWLTGTVAVDGDTETLSVCCCTVTREFPNLVVSCWEVAVTVTVAGVGATAGAVY